MRSFLGWPAKVFDADLLVLQAVATSLGHTNMSELNWSSNVAMCSRHTPGKSVHP